MAPATAPAVNAPTLVSSALDAANFGPVVRGYTIPYALAAIQEQGAGQAIVVNVFNPTVHFTSVAATAFPFNAQGAINLGHMGVSNVVVTSDPAGTTYVAGTDYTLDPVNGVITIIPTDCGWTYQLRELRCWWPSTMPIRPRSRTPTSSAR